MKQIIHKSIVGTVILAFVIFVLSYNNLIENLDKLIIVVGISFLINLLHFLLNSSRLNIFIKAFSLPIIICGVVIINMILYSNMLIDSWKSNLIVCLLIPYLFNLIYLYFGKSKVLDKKE